MSITTATDNQTEKLIVCKFCQNPIVGTSSFCVHCGRISADPDTRHLTELDIETARQHYAKRTWGNVFLEQPQRLIMNIEGHELPLPIQDEIIVGRSVGIEARPVDVDLTYFRAREYGVSRRHLAIARRAQFIYVTDLNASNGTWINDQRLIAGSARLLRHNDELQLGRLRLHILFGQTESDS